MAEERRGDGEDGAREPDASGVRNADATVVEPPPDVEEDGGFATVRASKYPAPVPRGTNTATSPSQLSPDDTQSSHELAIGRRALSSLAPPAPEEPVLLTKLRYERIELLGVGG